MSPTTAPATATDQVVARLGQIARLYAEMADLPVGALADATLDARTAAAAKAANAAQEMLARTVGEADAAGVAGRAGATSTKAWLIGRHAMSPRDAARAVAHAAAITPATEPTRLAWARGEICGDRAEAIAHAVSGLPDGADHRRVEAAQADLVRRATTMSLTELRREAARLVEKVVDPEDAERIRVDKLAEQEQRAYGQATLRDRRGLDGITRFSGSMPNTAFDMLTSNLDALSSPKRGRPYCDDTEGADVERVPYAVRMGRALVEWVERTDAKALSIGDGVNPTLLVTIDEQDLRDRVGTAVLSSGDEISVSEARRLACNADILPMVLGKDSQPVDLGRATRLFTKAQKVALAARDGGCVFPGCELPPGKPEAHHVRPWSAGGKTDLANGALLCGRRHRLIHQDDGEDGWQVRIAADGLPEVTPPKRIDRERRPIRHWRHRQRPEAC